jgi:hypothetical protein
MILSMILLLSRFHMVPAPLDCSNSPASDQQLMVEMLDLSAAIYVRQKFYTVIGHSAKSIYSNSTTPLRQGDLLFSTGDVTIIL